jgi:murein DD-endopeptidase MepM/ murein hydrolase activator NlpD
MPQRFALLTMALTACLGPSRATTGPKLETAIEKPTEASIQTGRGSAMPEARVLEWRERLKQPLSAAANEELRKDMSFFGDIPAWLASDFLAALTQHIPNTFTWPLALPITLTSPYGERAHPVSGELALHRGLDLLADFGEPVLASADGLVTSAQWQAGYGWQVTLEHADHWQTRYAHLSQILVNTGATAKQGQRLGLAGDSGNATGVHLHFEILKSTQDVDPTTVLPLLGTR